MDYRKAYISIIKNAQKQKREKYKGVYYENHHILPKSIFPLWKKRKSNLVLLTAREHFICHQLLTKIYPKKKMFCALWILMNDGQNNYCIKGSKEYERIKLQYLYHHKGGPKKGHIVSEETRNKIKNTLKGKMSGNKNPMYGKSSWDGISEEIRNLRIQKIKDSCTGKTLKSKGYIQMNKEGKLTLISKDKIKEYIDNGWNIGGVERKTKKIKCIETGIIFDSCRIATRKMGLSLNSSSSLGQAANGKRNLARGFHWEWVN